jgi:hypothetical protein
MAAWVDLPEALLLTCVESMSIDQAALRTTMVCHQWRHCVLANQAVYADIWRALCTGCGGWQMSASDMQTVETATAQVYGGLRDKWRKAALSLGTLSTPQSAQRLPRVDGSLFSINAIRALGDYDLLDKDAVRYTLDIWRYTPADGWEFDIESEQPHWHHEDVSRQYPWNSTSRGPPIWSMLSKHCNVRIARESKPELVCSHRLFGEAGVSVVEDITWGAFCAGCSHLGNSSLGIMLSKNMDCALSVVVTAMSQLGQFHTTVV